MVTTTWSDIVQPVIDADPLSEINNRIAFLETVVQGIKRQLYDEGRRIAKENDGNELLTSDEYERLNEELAEQQRLLTTARARRAVEMGRSRGPAKWWE